MVHRILGVVCGVLLAASLAWAADMEGTIKTVDQGQRMVTLEDGTQLVIAEGVAMDNLQEGKKVKLSYEERDGKNVLTGVEVQD